MRYLRTAPPRSYAGINAPARGVEKAANTLSCQISRCLTWLVPQPRHKTVKKRRLPWSERFDCIFRNEKAAGSNPASSTERPGQGGFPRVRKRVVFNDPVCAAPQRRHRIRALKHLAGDEVLRGNVDRSHRVIASGTSWFLSDR